MTIASPFPRDRLALCALIIILLLTGILRSSLLDVPLERDEGEYAYAGQLILQGIPPYEEVSNMKFPGIYAAYALSLALFGQSHQGIHTALLIINLLTIVLIFLLARRVTTLLGAVAAAASFALLSVSQPVQGLHANAEHFAVPFVIAGLIVLLRGLARGSLFTLFAAGLILGLASTMKQHAFAFTALAITYIVFHSLRLRPLMRSPLAKRMSAFAAGVLAIFGCLCLIMVWTGVFRAFFFWTVSYASSYVSKLPLDQAWPEFSSKFMPILASALPLWILVAFGFFCLASRRFAKHHRMFLLLFALFSFLSICPGLYFRPHYFVLLLPCASILAGVAIGVIADLLPGIRSRKLQYGVPIVLLIVCLCQSIYKQRDVLFRMTPFEMARSTHGLNPFSESLEIADFIRKRTDPKDRITILGSEPQIFFYSKRRSASRYIYMYPLMESHDYALKMQKDFIADVEAADPKYLIYVRVPTSWLKRTDSQQELLQWFGEYLRRDHLRMVGTVELWHDEARYFWEPEVRWPLVTDAWIVIFERTE